MRRALAGNAIPLFIIAALITVNAARGMLGVSVIRTITPGGRCEIHAIALRKGVAQIVGCPRRTDPLEESLYPHAMVSTDLFEPGWEMPSRASQLPVPEYGEVWYCPICRATRYAWEHRKIVRK